jgi:hypothetical protein
MEPLAGQLVVCLGGIASVLANREFDDDAATLWGAVCAAEETLGFRMLAPERRRCESRLSRLENTPAWNRQGRTNQRQGGKVLRAKLPPCRRQKKIDEHGRVR